MLDFQEAKLLFTNVNEEANITHYAVTFLEEFSGYCKSGFWKECFKQK